MLLGALSGESCEERDSAMEMAGTEPAIVRFMAYLHEDRNWEWALAFTLALGALVATFSAERSLRRYFLVGSGATFLAGLVLRFGHEWSHWVWVLASIPPAIVIQHAMFLGVVRR